MRLLVMLAAALGAAGAGGGAGLPPLSDVGCVEADEVLAFWQLEFMPFCVVLDSGESVVWTNPEDLEHDPGSTDDSGACFRARHDLGEQLQPGGTYRVRFSYDGVQALAEGAGVPRECDAALDQTSTAERAVIRYHCYDHPFARARLLIRAA